ncbi:MAG: hypothetical protein ABR974_08415 [Bacteroidales bacterium]|jgi:hypothetical protein
MTGIAIRIFKIIFILVSVVAITGTGCVSERKKYITYKKAESTCDLTRMGKNKYYYSSHYQRKLDKSIKEISRH